jgi:hypothetical protein
MALGACNFQIGCASSNLETDLESSRINTYFVCTVSRSISYILRAAGAYTSTMLQKLYTSFI